MFEQMTDSIQENVVRVMFHIVKNRAPVRRNVENRVMNESRGNEGNIWNTEVDDSNDTGINEWKEMKDSDDTNADDTTTEEKTTGDVNNTSEVASWTNEEKKTSQRKIPEWSKVEKKK